MACRRHPASANSFRGWRRTLFEVARMMVPRLLFLVNVFVLCSVAYAELALHGASVLDLASVPWTVQSKNVSAPAKIPSQVHLDLLAAGLIDEPTYGDNDFQQSWIATGNFTYRSAQLANLTKSSDYSTYLVFEGLDTLADIVFCGSHIGSVDNQFRKWTFDLSQALRNCTTSPSVEVAFHAAPAVSTNLVDEAYSKSGAFCIPCYGTKFQFPGRQFIRKEQSDYGWDWGPGFAPQGIWQPARIVQVPKTRSSVSIEGFYVDTYRVGQVNNLPPDQSAPWVLNVSVDYLGTLPNGTFMQVKLLDASGALFEKTEVSNPKIVTGKVTGSATLKNKPQLWWPVGHGNQTMYKLVVDIFSKNTSSAVVSTEKQIGFRTIVLNQTPVSAEQLLKGIAPGDNWHFEINGHEIYAKGSNLIPVDPFWPRVTKADVEILFSSAVAANQNMLRVWASNIYLPDYVYDLADEYGLLLWSEFQFSDAFYPNDDASVADYVKEASQQVRRINHHPSLALWCGGNELELALELVEIGAIYNYPAALANFESIFLDALLHAVFDNTRSISYMASSTNLGYESYDFNRSRPIKERYNDIGIGTVYGDSDYYNYDVTQAFTLSKYPVSRFTNEFGFHSHSSYATYSAYIPQDQLSFNSSILLHRNRHYPTSISDLSTQDPNTSQGNVTEKSLGGNGQMSQGATLYYPPPNKQDPATNFGMQIYATQLFQAEFVRSQIDFYRRGSGQRQRNLGSLYWQLNDIWAAPSWAGLEKGGRWKLLHHLAGNAYEPIVIAPFVDDLGGLSVSITSDQWQDAKGAASLRWYDWSGKQLNTSRDWAFDAKPVSVGALNSTQIWSQNLLFIPSELKAAVGVLRANITGADGSKYTAERFFVPQHLSNSASIKAFRDPSLKVAYDSSADAFTVTSKAVAAFVWLDQPLSSKGYFSRNGFWMLPGSQTVKFKPFGNGAGLQSGWQKNVTVKSVWDLTTP